jgi:hypothetical protein
VNPQNSLLSKAACIEGFREAVRSGVLEVRRPFRQTSAEAIVEASIRGGGNLLGGVDIADLEWAYVSRKP